MGNLAAKPAIAFLNAVTQASDDDSFHISALLVLFLAPIYPSCSRSFSFGLKGDGAVVDSYVLEWWSPNNLNEQKFFSPLVRTWQTMVDDRIVALLGSASEFGRTVIREGESEVEREKEK